MGASQLPGARRGMGASQLPGVRRGRGDSALGWGVKLLLLSSFIFLGARRGNGGVSASGGAKGEWRRVSFRGREGGMGASQLPGVRRGNDVSQLWGWV